MVSAGHVVVHVVQVWCLLYNYKTMVIPPLHYFTSACSCNLFSKIFTVSSYESHFSEIFQLFRSALNTSCKHVIDKIYCSYYAIIHLQYHISCSVKFEDHLSCDALLQFLNINKQ